MGPPFFKICCIAAVAEAEMAIAAGASAIGLVGPMPSGPGTIDRRTIADVASAVEGRIKRFLLTSETSIDALVAELASVDVDVVQLVDRIDGSLAELRERADVAEIVQVVHVEGPQAVDAAREAAEHADAILLDSGRPFADAKGGIRELGGTGRVHDWTVSRRVVEAVEVPVLLAGGLRPENVADAVADTRAAGVDVCSGVRVDGALDATLLTRFAANAGAAFRAL